MALKQEIRKALNDINLISVTISRFVGTPKCKPITQGLSFKTLLELHNNGFDVRKVFKYANESKKLEE